MSEQLVQATIERIRASGVHLVHGVARLEGDHTVLATAAGGQTRLHAESVIIATGSSPLRPAGAPSTIRASYDSETAIDIDPSRASC